MSVGDGGRGERQLGLLRPWCERNLENWFTTGALSACKSPRGS